MNSIAAPYSIVFTFAEVALDGVRAFADRAGHQLENGVPKGERQEDTGSRCRA
jgi:hypothetical protein